jgi:hypothetical protein
MDPITTLALTLGIGWASGINLYAAILTLGIMQAAGAIALPPNLEILAEPLVVFAAAFMYLVEFFADKIPGVDSGWDALHTFIRIPAGAVLAASAIGPVDPGWMLAAGLVGGALAASSHATKAGSRLLINASPEPFSNWAASVAEDVSVIAGLWLALHHPLIFIALLALFLALIAWLAPKLFRLIRRLVHKLFGRREQAPPTTA